VPVADRRQGRFRFLQASLKRFDVNAQVSAC
jgi:hypothetical protein